jgi:putative resolvase
MNKYFTSSQAAKYLMVSRSSIQKYRESGKLVPIGKTPGGNWRYSKEALDAVLGIRLSATDGMVFYVRASSSSTPLKPQEDKLREAYGEPVKVYKDHASGLNEKRKGLASLLDGARKHEYKTICITAEDRLTRFGYSYLKQLLDEYGVTIRVLNDKTAKSPHEELMQDFMSLLASFSGKFYKLRSLKHEELLLDEARRRVKHEEEK